MGLLTGKDKYAVETAKQFNIQGGAEERDGKLYFKGTVATQDQANKIWMPSRRFRTGARKSWRTSRPAAEPCPKPTQ